MAVNEIARVYATSLVEVGMEKKILDRIEQEMKAVSDIYDEDRDFRLFITSPGFSKESKEEFVGKVFSKTMSEYMVNLLNLLIENDRQSFISDINNALTELIDEVNNRLRVDVTTAGALDKDSLKRITDELKKKYNKDIIINESRDESILGGIIIKIGDLVIDGSLVKDLKNIRTNLLNEKVRSDLAYED